MSSIGVKQVWDTGPQTFYIPVFDCYGNCIFFLCMLGVVSARIQSRVMVMHEPPNICPHNTGEPGDKGAGRGKQSSDDAVCVPVPAVVNDQRAAGLRCADVCDVLVSHKCTTGAKQSVLLELIKYEDGRHLLMNTTKFLWVIHNTQTPARVCQQNILTVCAQSHSILGCHVQMLRAVPVRPV